MFQKQKQERAGAEANTQMRGVTNIPALGRWPVKAVMGGCGVLFRDAVGDRGAGLAGNTTGTLQVYGGRGSSVYARRVTGKILVGGLRRVRLLDDVEVRRGVLAVFGAEKRGMRLAEGRLGRLHVNSRAASSSFLPARRVSHSKRTRRRVWGLGWGRV